MRPVGAKRFIVVLSWAVCLTTGSLATPVCRPVFAQMEGDRGQWALAEHLFQDGEYYRAVTEYKRFLYHFPDDPRADEARVRIVEAHVRGGWWAEGRRAAQDVLDRGAEGEIRARVLYLSAVCEVRLGLLAEARTSLTEVVATTRDPELKGKAQYLLAETRGREGAWLDAVRVLEGLNPLVGLGDRASMAAARIRERVPLPEKSPWTAGFLAAVLPGAGHAYAGRWRDAGLVFSVNAAFTAATIEAIQKDNPMLAGGLALAELLWYSGNIFSAVGSAHKHNREAQEQLMREVQLPPQWVEQLPPSGSRSWRGVP